MPHTHAVDGNCPICDREFDDDAELERHAESAHDVLGEFLDT